MIFVTVGMRLPFDRLIEAMDGWAAEHPRQEVFGQILQRTQDCEKDPYIPQHFAWKAEIDPVEFETRCREAQVIVGHAGTGTMLAAMTHRKPLIMMTRKAAFREHRNDHQVATANYFRKLAGVSVVEDGDALAARLDALLADPQAETAMPSHASPELIATIRREILAPSGRTGNG